MPQLKGQIALVVGGAGGIGRATSLQFAAEGASVVVADRDHESAETLCAEIAHAGGQAIAQRVDFTSLTDLETLMSRVEAQFGHLNVLFSNVGSRCASGFNITAKDFDDAIALNLKNHFFLTNLAVPLLRKGASRASVIYMASGAGLRYFGRSPLYSISKAGLLMMMRTFSRELAVDGIRVNAVCPGPIETGFPLAGVDEAEKARIIERMAGEIPLGRIGQPQDVASVVAFLASDSAAYLSGLAIPVDGGALA